MFEGRAEQVDLISLLSTGEARGATNSLLRVYWICVKDVAAAVCTSIYFELCCLITGEFFSSPPS